MYRTQWAQRSPLLKGGRNRGLVKTIGSQIEAKFGFTERIVLA
jgi:hypothetical protein